jgi:membrane associated rhomboid family serine protease
MTQSLPGALACYRHPARETYVRCNRCGRPICPDCMRTASVGHQCPECVAEGRRTSRPVRTAFGGSGVGANGYATFSLIGINVFVMVVALLSSGRANALAGGGMGGLLGGLTPLHYWGALVSLPTSFTDNQGNVVASVNGVAGGDYYRLLTSMFIHFGLLHLLLNMWALYVLGRPIEAALGPLRFLALYLTAGFGGSVAVYWLTNHSPTAGASGAIFGLFSALIVVLRKLGRSASSVIPILIVNLVITFGVPGISIAGHLGGLVTGGLAAAGLAYAPQKNRTLIQAGVIIAILLLLGMLTLARTVLLSSG